MPDSKTESFSAAYKRMWRESPVTTTFAHGPVAGLALVLALAFHGASEPDLDIQDLNNTPAYHQEP